MRPVTDSAHVGHFFRRAGDDDAAALVGRAGPEVDDLVGRLHQLQIVLDDHQRMADVEQRVEAIDQLYDVGKVQAGRRLVEQEQRPAAPLGRPGGRPA